MCIIKSDITNPAISLGVLLRGTSQHRTLIVIKRPLPSPQTKTSCRMGNKGSKSEPAHGETHRTATHSHESHFEDEQPSAPPPANASFHRAPDAEPLLIGYPNTVPQASTFWGFSTQQALLKTILLELPSGLKEKWKLLFDSKLHGKSFSQLLERIVNAGPTLIVISEQLPPHADDGTSPSPRVFGGFCSSSWLTVQDREKAAQSAMAARARAQRTGCASPVPDRPRNQASQFFGSSDCFVFTSSTAGQDQRPVAYLSKPHINSNFMYLFDRHPDSERIGIGMGGTAGQHAWFLDSWLETGHCKGTVCPTFGNPMLCPRETFHVSRVEVFALDASKFTEDDLSPVDETAMSPAKSNLLSPENHKTNVDKILLELHGVHNFRSDQDPSCT